MYEEPPALASRVPGLPPAITAAVARAMAKKADERFPSVGAFIEALTGQPLLQVRTTTLPPPEVGFAAGSKHRSTGHDAFAQTMGSVDHGTVPMTAAVPAGTANPPPPEKPTVPARGDNVATVPAVPSRKRRRPAALLAAGGLALTAATAAIVYFAMRPAPAPRSQPPVVQGGGGATVAPADAAEMPASPADAAVVAAPPADAAPPQRDAGVAVRVRPDPPEGADEKGDEASEQSLKDAEAALAAGQHDRAERLANTVMNSPDARPRQRARAHLVRGIAKCAQQDQEAATIALRNLRGFRALQARLIAQCKRAGVDLR